MSERLNKVHLIISSIAATIVAIGFIVIHVYGETHGLLLMAMWVSIAIILFYFIGHLARAFLITKVFVIPGEDEELDFSEFSDEDVDEVMVSLDDMDMPEDTMIHAPSHDDINGINGINGTNGDVLASERMLEEAQSDYD